MLLIGSLPTRSSILLLGLEVAGLPQEQRHLKRVRPVRVKPVLSSKWHSISLVMLCVSDQVVRPTPTQGGGINPLPLVGGAMEGFVAICGFLCGGKW